MVNFKFAKLPDPRATPEIKARFIHLGQLVEWNYTDKSGLYSGLIFIGEKPHPQGFQSVAEFTINLEQKEIPIAKVQELTQLVMGEFQRRGVVLLKKPGQG